MKHRDDYSYRFGYNTNIASELKLDKDGQYSLNFVSDNVDTTASRSNTESQPTKAKIANGIADNAIKSTYRHPVDVQTERRMLFDYTPSNREFEDGEYDDSIRMMLDTTYTLNLKQRSHVYDFADYLVNKYRQIEKKLQLLENDETYKNELAIWENLQDKVDMYQNYRMPATPPYIRLHDILTNDQRRLLKYLNIVNDKIHEFDAKMDK